MLTRRHFIAAASLVATLFSVVCQSALAARTVEFRPDGVPASAEAKGFEGTAKDLSYRYYQLGGSVPASGDIVVFVPGSGCDAALALDPTGHATAGNEIFALPRKKEVGIFALEAPGVARQRPSAHRGLADGCPSAFLAHDNVSGRLAAYEASVDDIIERARPLHLHMLIVGVSDGALLAALLSKHYQEVSGVVMISGFGISQSQSQLRSLIQQTVEHPADGAELKELLSHMDGTRPSMPSTAVWHGQTYGRWASLARTSGASAVLDLERSVPVVVVQGGADENWPPEGFFDGLTVLASAGRGVFVNYIACADHQLMCKTDAGQPSRLDQVIQEAITWAVTKRAPAHWTILPSLPQASSTNQN